MFLSFDKMVKLLNISEYLKKYTKEDLQFLKDIVNQYEFNCFKQNTLYFKLYDYHINIDLTDILSANYSYDLLKKILDDENKIRLLYLITNSKDLLAYKIAIITVIDFSQEEVDKLLETLLFLNEHTERAFIENRNNYYDFISNRIYYEYIFLDDIGGMVFDFDFKHKDRLQKQLLWFDLMKPQLLKLIMLNKIGVN